MSLGIVERNRLKGRWLFSEAEDGYGIRDTGQGIRDTGDGTQGSGIGDQGLGIRMADRVLLFATTTGYQTRSFAEAAERLGVRLTLATDRCITLDDPWRDQALPVRFHDEAASIQTIVK